MVVLGKEGGKGALVLLVEQAVRLPLRGLVPIASVSVKESPVTVLPPASWTVPFGWVAKAVPPVALDGCWLKASWAAVPTVMLKLLLSVAVRVPSVAWRV